MLRSIKLVVFCLFTHISLFSQVEKFTEADKAFFQNTALQYNRWLQSIGLSPLMGVEKVIVTKEDTELEMRIVLTTHDVDVAIAQWRALRSKLAKEKGDSIALEKMLFETFARQMQIPEEQGNIQVYVKDEIGDYSHYFAILIWSENGVVKTEDRTFKSKPIDIAVTLPPLRTPKGQSNTVQRPFSSNDSVFAKIQRYAVDQFEKTKCYDRYSKVEVDFTKSKGNVLVFSVTDLCRVVLKDEDKTFWCKGAEALGLKCNDITRERLIFTFNYEAMGNNGYHLTGELQGLFGSGVFKPRVSGYMDMEPDFNDYLTTYANEFQGRLKAYLEKQ